MPPERPRQKPERSGKPAKRPTPPATGERRTSSPSDRKPYDPESTGRRRSSSAKPGERPRRSTERKPSDKRSGADKWSRADRGTPTDRPRRSVGASRKQTDPPKAAPRKGWGSVARRGAGSLAEDQETASRIWRDAVKRARDEPPPGSRSRGEDWEPEVWREDRGPSTRPAKRKAEHEPTPEKRGLKPRKLAGEVVGELTAARGERRGSRLQARLSDAAGAFERGRYLDARRMLRPLAEEAPGAASVRELYGLTLYHLERWKDAARELEAFRSLSGSVEQHPVLADSYRALRRYKKVDELWEELRQASPGAELVAEGRIVAAGALADKGDVPGAIALLERAKLDLKRPKPHQLRLLYALADLYERAGDIPKARELFRRIMRSDPAFYDAADRAKALG